MAEIFTSTKGEKLRALILAAGFGSRLMPLTQTKPKCMVEYEGRAIIDYEIEALRACGIDEIAVVGGYLYSVLESYLSKHAITTMYENPRYASTNMVQTMLCAREWIESCAKEGQDLLISYADIVYFAPCVQKLCKSSAPVAIAVDRCWEQLWRKRFSDVLLDAESLKIHNGKITELGKKPKSLDEIQGQYMGLFAFRHDFLPQMLELYDGLDRSAIYDGKDFANMYMTSFLQALIDTFDNAHAVEIDGGWLEVDMPSDLAISLQDIQAIAAQRGK